MDQKRGPRIINGAPADVGPEWGYIDRTGKMVIAPEFTGARPFGPGGLAPAKHGNEWGLIDTAGKWVAAPQYNRLDGYNDDGFAYFVKVYGKTGYLSADGREVLTLVNLRRRFAPTHFGSIGGEWDKELNTIVEPWRLSIWSWKYDPVNEDMLLAGRGTFFRRIFLPEHPTPEAGISDELWQSRREGNTLIVGRSGAGRD